MKKICLLLIGVLLLFGCNKKKTVDNNIDNNDIQNNVVESGGDTPWDSLRMFPLMDEDVTYITLSYDGYSCELDDVGDCREIDPYKNNKYDFNMSEVNIKFNCLKYIDSDDEDYEMFCSKNKITIDNKINFEYTNDLEYDDKSTIILKTNDYYVLKQVNVEYGRGLLNIYSKDGKLLKSYKNTVTEFEILPDSESEEYETNVYNPVISNNKLYFIVTGDTYLEDGLENNIDFVSVTLNKDLEYNKLYTTHALVAFGI